MKEQRISLLLRNTVYDNRVVEFLEEGKHEAFEQNAEKAKNFLRQRKVRSVLIPYTPTHRITIFHYYLSLYLTQLEETRMPIYLLLTDVPSILNREPEQIEMDIRKHIIFLKSIGLDVENSEKYRQLRLTQCLEKISSDPEIREHFERLRTGYERKGENVTFALSHALSTVLTCIYISRSDVVIIGRNLEDVYSSVIEELAESIGFSPMILYLHYIPLDGVIYLDDQPSVISEKLRTVFFGKKDGMLLVKTLYRFLILRDNEKKYKRLKESIISEPTDTEARIQELTNALTGHFNAIVRNWRKEWVRSFGPLPSMTITKMEDTVNVLDALSLQESRKILSCLRDRPLYVDEIAEKTELDHNQIQKTLSTLESLGLVLSMPAKGEMRYRLMAKRFDIIFDSSELSDVSA